MTYSVSSLQAIDIYEFFLTSHPSVLYMLRPVSAFHVTDFDSSEHSKEKVYEVYTQCELSWSIVSIRTGCCQ